MNIEKIDIDERPWSKYYKVTINGFTYGLSCYASIFKIFGFEEIIQSYEPGENDGDGDWHPNNIGYMWHIGRSEKDSYVVFPQFYDSNDISRNDDFFLRSPSMDPIRITLLKEKINAIYETAYKFNSYAAMKKWLLDMEKDGFPDHMDHEAWDNLKEYFAWYEKTIGAEDQPF